MNENTSSLLKAVFAAGLFAGVVGLLVEDTHPVFAARMFGYAVLGMFSATVWLMGVIERTIGWGKEQEHESSPSRLSSQPPRPASANSPTRK